MKAIVILLNVIMSIYFVFVAYFFGILNIFALIINGGIFEYIRNNSPWWTLFWAMVILFWLYAPILFLQRSDYKYYYGYSILITYGLVWQIYRFFYVNNYGFDQTDLRNLLIIGLPVLVILFTDFLNVRVLKKEYKTAERK